MYLGYPFLKDIVFLTKGLHIPSLKLTLPNLSFREDRIHRFLDGLVGVIRIDGLIPFGSGESRILRTYKRIFRDRIHHFLTYEHPEIPNSSTQQISPDAFTFDNLRKQISTCRRDKRVDEEYLKGPPTSDISRVK